MEGVEGQLCTRLTDRLCSDHTDRLCGLYEVSGRHVDTVTLARNTFEVVRAENRLDLYFRDFFVFFDRIGDFTRDELIGFDVTRHCCGRVAAKEAVAKFDHRVLRLAAVDREAFVVAFLVFDRENVLAHVNETAGQIS